MLKNEKMKRWLRILGMVMATVMLLSVLAGCNKTGDGDGDKDDNDKTDEQIVDTSKMSGPEHWQYVTGKSIGEALGSITGTYGTVLGAMNGNGPQGARVDMTVELGDMILEALVDQSADEKLDLSFLKNIKLGMDVKSDSDKSQVDMLLGLGSHEIATISAIVDMAGGEAFLGLPGLNETYLGFDIGELGMDMSQMEQATELIETVLAAMPSEEVLQKLVDKYVAIALKEFKNIEKESAKLELNGLSQDCTKLTVTVHHEDVLNVAKNVLTELKSDADVKKILEDVSDITELSGGEDVYAAFQEGLEDALEEIEDQLEDPEEEVIMLITYADSKNNVIGLCLSSTESGDEDMHYTLVTQDGKFAFELGFLDEMTVEGDGTTKDNKVNGEFVVETQGQEVLHLALKDFDMSKLDKGQVSGTVVIAAPETDDMPVMLDGMKLSIGLDTGKDSATVSLKAENDMGVIASIRMEYKATSGGSITVPGNAVDAMDQTELMQWLMGLNFEKLNDNLKKAGLPEELMTALVQVAGQMAGIQ